MTALILLGLGLGLPAPGPDARLRGAPRGASRLISGGVGNRSLGVVFSLSLTVVILSFLMIGEPTVALAAGIIIGTVAWSLRQLRAERRSRHRSAATGVFLGHLLGELRAGSGIPQAMSAAADSVREDAPPEFRSAVEVTAARTRAGGSGPDVLHDARELVPELGELAHMWRTAEHHGVPLAPLLGEARKRLDARTRHRAATNASLQGPQATAVVLTLLPLAGIGMGGAMGADPVGLLFGGGLGGLLLLCGVGLSCSGFLWSRKIITAAGK